MEIMDIPIHLLKASDGEEEFIDTWCERPRSRPMDSSERKRWSEEEENAWLQIEWENRL